MAGSARKVNVYARPPYSVYQQLKAAGYKDCELVGVTDLSESDRAAPQRVYEQKPEYAIVEKFIQAVMRHIGQDKVDIVSHSLGVSTAMAALTYYGEWGGVRRFINIAGTLPGFDSCARVGFANPCAPAAGGGVRAESLERKGHARRLSPERGGVPATAAARQA